MANIFGGNFCDLFFCVFKGSDWRLWGRSIISASERGWRKQWRSCFGTVVSFEYGRVYSIQRNNDRSCWHRCMRGHFSIRILTKCSSSAKRTISMTGNGKWKLTSLSSKSPLYSSARKCVILFNNDQNVWSWLSNKTTMNTWKTICVALSTKTRPQYFGFKPSLFQNGCQFNI